MTQPSDRGRARDASCAPGAGRCVTCADEALEVTVVWADAALGLALVAVGGGEEEVDVSLVDDVAPGDTLLVHGGAALAKL